MAELGNAESFGAAQEAREDVCQALRVEPGNSAAAAMLKVVKGLCKSCVRIEPQEIIIGINPKP